MTDPREGGVYQHLPTGQEVLVDHVTDDIVRFRVTDGNGGLLRALQVTRADWAFLSESHGLQLNRKATP